ncbi:MAG: YraN family protein [Bacteroidales bacterium]|nr:YraN family protein [Candidatus Colicola equi]
MAFFHLHRQEDKGDLGESIAANLLRQKGYTIVEQNLKVNSKEIDIIATNDQYVVFCEVKTRTSTFGGHPEQFVNKEKQKNMIFAANAYIKHVGEKRSPRFDVIGVLLDKQTGDIQELNHIEDAFFPSVRTVHASSYSGRYKWHSKSVWKTKR